MLVEKYICLSCCCNRNHLTIIGIAISSDKLGNQNEIEIEIEVLHSTTSPIQSAVFNISRLLSKLRNGLRSTVYFAFCFSAFHVNETDIMYNIFKDTKFSATSRRRQQKHILDIQLLFQLLLMPLHDSRFLPNETAYRASLQVECIAPCRSQ